MNLAVEKSQKVKQHTIHDMGKKLLKTAARVQPFLHVSVDRHHLNCQHPPGVKYHKMCTIHTYHTKIKP